MIVPELGAVNVVDLPDADGPVFRKLVARWMQKLRRNLLRTHYYDGKNRMKDLGIAIPPQLKRIETVVGWPAKAVDVLANRVRFDGFVAADDDQDPLGLSATLRDNDFNAELAQATRSALMHGCAFVSVSNGDPDQGEPDVVVRFRSALFASGLWDIKRRRLSAALTVNDVDQETWETGEAHPTDLTLFMPDHVVNVQWDGASWQTAVVPHSFGHVPVFALRYHPDLDRPFGRSRISRAVMSITDSAVRTALRTEVSAEFFTAPQRYVLGADDGAFTTPNGAPIPGWQAIVGRVLALSRDEDGNLPTVGQFSQMTMQPHVDQFRALAARFSGETGIPMASLGVVDAAGQGSSADSIFAAQEDLVIEAENTISVFSSPLRDLARDIVVARGDTPDESVLATLQPNFRRPDRPSQASMSDAALKQVQAVPWLANTRVILEELGLTQGQILRALSDQKRQQGTALVQQLLGGVNGQQGAGGSAGGVGGGVGVSGAAGSGTASAADGGSVG